MTPFVQCIIAAALGMLLNQLGDIHASGLKWSEFSIKKWADENLIQFITGCVLMVLLLLFPEIMTTIGFSGEPIAYGLAGAGIDQVTNVFFKRARNKEQQ